MGSFLDFKTGVFLPKNSDKYVCMVFWKKDATVVTGGGNTKEEAIKDAKKILLFASGRNRYISKFFSFEVVSRATFLAKYKKKIIENERKKKIKRNLEYNSKTKAAAEKWFW